MTSVATGDENEFLSSLAIRAKEAKGKQLNATGAIVTHSKLRLVYPTTKALKTTPGKISKLCDLWCV